MPTWSGLQIRLPKAGLTLFHLFIFPLRLNFDSQFFQIFILYLDLPLIANFSNFNFTHLDLPSTASSFHLFFFFYLPGLTSECRFDCALTLSLMFTWLDLHFWCQTCWDLGLFENPDLTKLSSFVRRSFWSFYRVHYPFSFCIPVSDEQTNIWCNVSCDVWLCTNEMSEHFLNSFFFFLHFNECEMQMSYANAMIGFTNALCNHCALICYW